MRALRRFPRGSALAALLLAALGAPGAVAQDAGEPKLAGTVADLEACLAREADHPRDCIGRLGNRCQETPGGDTTIGITACNEQEADLWDALLNARYAALVARTREGAGERGDVDAVASLRDAQRKWIGFRDAECERLFDYWSSGTIRTIVASSCRMTLTAERAISLDPDEAR